MFLLFYYVGLPLNWRLFYHIHFGKMHTFKALPRTEKRNQKNESENERVAMQCYRKDPMKFTVKSDTRMCVQKHIFDSRFHIFCMYV